MMRLKNGIRIGLLAALLPLAACGDILEVESPGRIADADLNDKDAISGLVVGMSYAIADAIGDEAAAFLALASGELWHGGSYDWNEVPIGVIEEDDVNNVWEEMHQARWVAEDGLRRIQENILTEEEFNRSAQVARAYLFAGIANRMLGENMCEAVFDGGPAEPHTAHFVRAEQQFTEAIRIGTAAGADEIVTAAHAGRASVRAWQGNWTGAVQDAQQVPDDFEYLALLNAENPSNDLYYETHNRFEYTVFSTYLDEQGDPDDPRAPWHIVYRADGSIAAGANGSTPHYMQDKYDSFGADVPLVKGPEMLLLRAEAALRSNDVATATILMNQARAVYDMDPLPLTATATLADAWDTLHFERGATLWLEGRRFWDLRRWVNETGPAHHDFLANRDRCIPISEEERRSNPNV